MGSEMCIRDRPDIVGKAFGHDARTDYADEKEDGAEELGEQAAGEVVHMRSCTTAARFSTLSTPSPPGWGLGPGRRAPSTGPQFPWRGIGGQKPPSWCQNGPASV